MKVFPANHLKIGHLQKFCPAKCENLSGIDVLNGVKVALCGMKSVDLSKDSVKILGTYYSYDKELEQTIKTIRKQ